jgi:hypothetical protein
MDSPTGRFELNPAVDFPQGDEQHFDFRVGVLAGQREP